MLGSLLVVAGWEFCRPRRPREFPALRRRLGNIGFWVLNLVLAGFTFEPAAQFRPRLEAVLGIGFPAWPIADAGLSLGGGFLLLGLYRVFGPSLSTHGAACGLCTVRCNKCLHAELRW